MWHRHVSKGRAGSHTAIIWLQYLASMGPCLLLPSVSDAAFSCWNPSPMHYINMCIYIYIYCSSLRATIFAFTISMQPHSRPWAQLGKMATGGTPWQRSFGIWSNLQQNELLINESSSIFIKDNEKIWKGIIEVAHLPILLESSVLKWPWPRIPAFFIVNYVVSCWISKAHLEMAPVVRHASCGYYGETTNEKSRWNSTILVNCLSKK